MRRQQEFAQRLRGRGRPVGDRTEARGGRPEDGLVRLLRRHQVARRANLERKAFSLVRVGASGGFLSACLNREKLGKGGEDGEPREFDSIPVPRLQAAVSFPWLQGEIRSQRAPAARGSGRAQMQ